MHSLRITKVFREIIFRNGIWALKHRFKVVVRPIGVLYDLG